MPIYEFYCPPCHTLYQFLARRINTTSQPPCPDCARSLKREVSPFAALRHRGDAAEGEGDDADFPIDEQRMEQAMSQMAGDMEHIDESDPKQAAALMRKFASLTGMRFKGGVEEAVARMEAGEYPESVEAELGDALEGDDPFEVDGESRGRRLRRLLTGPRRDTTLYEM